MEEIKRLKHCEISKVDTPTKKRRLHFNPGHLKTLPAAVFRAVRGFVKRSPKEPTVAKDKAGNLSVVCFDELFHLPFNVVPTVDGTFDRSNLIICPGLQEAVKFPYYFGAIDRHEAAKLLEGLEHGSFLLRDSSHNDFRFSVSFRVSDATVHARICYNKGRYTFKIDDNMRFSSDNLQNFLKHYNYVNRYVFDEPYLLKPKNRTQVFPLQFMCVAMLASRCTPNGLKKLPIPQTMKESIISSFAVVERVSSVNAR